MLFGWNLGILRGLACVVLLIFWVFLGVSGVLGFGNCFGVSTSGVASCLLHFGF